MSQERVKYLPSAAASLGRQIEFLLAPTNREVGEIIASLAQKQIDALYVTPNPGFNPGQITTATARYTVPAIYSSRNYANVGGLMSYGSIPEENWRLVGTYVGRILKGEKAADLPVVRPTSFKFVINLQTAKLLGLTVPPTLLAITDEVIE